MSFESPLVSVVIPMYNIEEYIGETLQSALNQTYKNIEIVVVDDGSIDKSAAVIRSFQQKYNNIKYVYQKNSGVSSARNIGIQNSQGSYIAFLDSDDLWQDTKIEKQLNRILKSGMEVCYCGYREFSDSGMGKKMPRKYYEGKFLPQFLKDQAICWTTTWLIKKKILLTNNICFSVGCNLAEDIEFFAMVAAFSEVCCVKEHLALYRKRSNSLSVSPKRATEIMVWNRLISWFDSNSNLQLYNKAEIINVLRMYRLAGTAVHCLFESQILKIDMSNNISNQELFEYAKVYKPNSTYHSIKLFVKKIILKNKLLNRSISWVIAKKQGK